MFIQWRPVLLLIGMLATPCLIQLRANEEEVAYYYDDSEAAESNAFLASFQQPRIQQPAGALPPESRARSSSSPARSFSSYTRLARAPNMFGDFIGLGQVLVANRTEGTVTSDLPIGGGSSFKIGENNKPIPVDRIYFNFNGFQNAVQFTEQLGPNAGPRDANLNRYTFGFEKTFLAGDASIDVRLPLTDGFQGASPAFAVDTGEYGNISMFFKHLIYRDDIHALSYGCGVGLPTGSNTDVFVNGSPVTLQNEAVHLMPFIGYYSMPSEDWFYQAFLQLDFAANGNDVVGGAPGRSLGRLNDQNLFQTDFSLGRWLYRNYDSGYSRGLAGVLELHYTSTMQDADVLNVAVVTARSGTIGGQFGNPANRSDILNLTAGLHWQLTDLSNFRVGCAIPLRNDPDRQFDTEIQASFNRYF